MNEVERVKLICKEKRIPIRQLEKQCGFSNGYISGIKKGVFPSDRLFKIADFLGVSATVLSDTAFEMAERRNCIFRDESDEGTLKPDFREVSVRLVPGKKPFCDGIIQSPIQAVAVLGEMMCSFDREVVMVLNLQTDGKPINFSICSIGAINYSVASPREILKSSILSNAANIMLLHNHPSNRLVPSREDIIMTDHLIRVCQFAEIPLLDHIIVGNDVSSGYFSMREKRVELFHVKMKPKTSLHELDFQPEPFGTAVVAEENRETLKGKTR